MLKLVKFNEKEIPILTIIMKEAFDEDSRIHLNGMTGGPDGYDDGRFLTKWFMDLHATPYTIYEDDLIIGAVNLWLNKNNYNFLGCLFIDVNKENLGYGFKVWKMIEEMYPDTICWRTETPIFSRRNHHFYINKCGFKCVKIDNPKDILEGSFLLEKEISKDDNNKL